MQTPKNPPAIAASVTQVHHLTQTPADPLKDDFRLFLTMIWRFLGLPDPTTVQLDIARLLQHGPRRRIVMAFRGVGKSWITAAYVLWRLYCDPQSKIMVVSATKTRADDFAIFVKRLIEEVPFLKHLRPGEDQRWSNISFDVGPAKPAQSPSVKSVGVFGQLTGSRANEIVADDVEIPSNTLTQGMRNKLWEAVKEFDAVLSPGGYVTYLGTPQAAQSLYGELQNRGYTARIWPAEVPTVEQQAVYGTQLAPAILKLGQEAYRFGKSTEPARFSDFDLAERRTSYGRAGYALQFMLDTSYSDANKYPLKLSDLIVTPIAGDRAPMQFTWACTPELACNDLPCVGMNGDGLFRPMPWAQHQQPPVADYQGSMMYIDPSGRGKDETGYAVVKMLHGYLFVTACGGYAGGYEKDTLKKLALVAKKHDVNFIRIEDNFGDGMWTELFKPILFKHHRTTVEAEKVHGQKELRIIDTLEPVMSSHRLVIDPKLVTEDYEDQNLAGGTEYAQNYMLFYQMTHITAERGALPHDDRLEALAGAVRYWTEQMAADDELKRDEYRDTMMTQELERYLDHVIGGRPKRDNWISL